MQAANYLYFKNKDTDSTKSNNMNSCIVGVNETWDKNGMLVKGYIYTIL